MKGRQTKNAILSGVQEEVTIRLILNFNFIAHFNKKQE